MKHYNKNRVNIGDEDIESTKNFESLLNNYYTTPKVYNKPMMWSAAASIIAVVGIMAYSYLKTDAPDSATKPFVNPPLAGVTIPDTTLQIDAETGGTIILPSGSMIEVPANAFVNTDGSMVKGMVDLRYREFRKPTEFFVSGIPMTYDSAGTKYTFESAGMFDLTGFSGDKAIKIAEGKSLNVNMSSIYKEEKYNKYRLNTVSKTWVYLGKDELEKKEIKDSMLAKSERLKYSKEETASTGITDARTEEVAINMPKIAKETEPAKPNKATSTKNTFKLEVDPGQFPEIAVYKDVLFEIPLAQYNKLPANFDKTDFEDVKIVRSSKDGYYNFTLVKPNAGNDPQVYNLTDCRPVFAGTDYDEAIKTYNNLYTKYESRYKGKVIQQERDQKKLAEAEAKDKEAYAKFETSRAEFAKRQAEAWEKQNKANYIQSIGYRAFQVREFGMYNSDCPSNMPVGATVIATVTDDKGNKLKYNSLYMVDAGRNALYTIYTNNGKASLSYNPESLTTFWVVTSEGKIAMIDSENVKKIKTTKEGVNQLTFAMHVSDQELKTEKEIAEFLNLN